MSLARALEACSRGIAVVMSGVCVCVCVYIKMCIRDRFCNLLQLKIINEDSNFSFQFDA